MSKKTGTYFFMTFLLLYFGLRHLDSFNVLYDGLALVTSLGSLVLGIMSYLEDKKNK
jgi:hypothetical protein